VKVQLPFKQLHQLQSFTCEYCVLFKRQLGAASSSGGSSGASSSADGGGSLSCLTSLTALTLERVALDSCLWEGGQHVSALTGLRQLTLSLVSDIVYGAYGISYGAYGISDQCISPLLQLRQLTALEIACASRQRCSCDAAVDVIVQLTGLQRLAFYLGVELEGPEAARLVALTNLTQLRCAYSVQRSQKRRPSLENAVNISSTVSFATC
jgi:hypothetical protein